MKAVDFDLPDEYGVRHKLSDYRGKWLLLYFYPKDSTPGCTREACNFRDRRTEYKKAGITVVGVSKDSPISHQKFIHKHDLNFSLLADESAETIKTYGAWGEKKFLGKIFSGVLRKSFLINPEGEIVKEYDKVDVNSHAEEILKDQKIFINK